MSRMLRKNDCVPAGTLIQLMAGDSPSPVATPGAAWLNFTGMSAPSAKPATVSVRAGAGGAAGCCAGLGIAASRAIVGTTNQASRRIRPLLPPLLVGALCSVTPARFRHDGLA